MKGRWCGEFNNGRCNISVDDETPSLAERLTEVLGVKENEETLTNYSAIYDFLALYDPEVLSSGHIPKTVVVKRHEPIEKDYFRCKARNCRSKQRDCSCYKK